MVTAYLCLGDYAAAQQLQHNVFNLLNQPALKASDFYLFHHNNFVLFLRQNRLAEAGAELKVMQAMASERYMPYRLVVQYDQSNRARQYELNVAYGLYDDAAQFFSISFEHEPHNIGKVSIMLILAKIYIHDKQWGAARAALDYVLQNGSKTVYAAEAASLLLTLNV